MITTTFVLSHGIYFLNKKWTGQFKFHFVDDWSIKSNDEKQIIIGLSKAVIVIQWP